MLLFATSTGMFFPLEVRQKNASGSSKEKLCKGHSHIQDVSINSYRNGKGFSSYSHEYPSLFIHLGNLLSKSNSASYTSDPASVYKHNAR